MKNNEPAPAPRLYRGVMISSTFTDLKAHRAALIKILKANGLTDVAMENDSARAGLDVIASSLRMVLDGSAFIGIISRKYGQTPKSPSRNPGSLSLTELEFDEAQKLGRPTLLFLMSGKHRLVEADVETSTTKKRKLNAFRERAKQMGPDNEVHRVYAEFSSLAEFKEMAATAVADLRRYLDELQAVQTLATTPEAATGSVRARNLDAIPHPPAFYAEPPYVGSHTFVGRQYELGQLSDWASSANQHPVLLFEAIGGSGKSMLTWEWTTKHAARVRQDWAGRFWYSFYEKGAVLADFCRRALAYITGEPLEVLNKQKTPELAERLLRYLQAQPWLLVLDGLERLLVSYHRFDAAQVLDEDAGTSDAILQRDPCAAIRPEDEDLLRSLAGATPSKILLTSRLTPRILLNASGQAIPGVVRIALPGLRPADAEELLRSCGVTGSSTAMQEYLQTNCDCHPLVTGILGGLVREYFPARGNFDVWAAAPAAGAGLHLGELDLVQRRNHILRAALEALPEKSRELLSTLALLSEAVASEVLQALNPFLPAEPDNVDEPQPPESHWRWDFLSAEQKAAARDDYLVELKRYEDYQKAVEARLRSPEFQAAPGDLGRTVIDLEHRGLLQYDAATESYDLHPVVRGVAAGGLRLEEKERYGERVVDYFSSRSHDPYEEAETLDDLRDGLRVVRGLLQMGRFEQAYAEYSGDLADALLFNLEGGSEVLALLRPFFPKGWGHLPENLIQSEANYIANDAAIALDREDAIEESLALHKLGLSSKLKAEDWPETIISLRNLSLTIRARGRLDQSERVNLLALTLSELLDSKQYLFLSRHSLFSMWVELGRWTEAQALWEQLEPMGRDWSRARYRPGEAEEWYCLFLFRRGLLAEAQIEGAIQLAQAGLNRSTLRFLHGLRGEWQLTKGDHTGAVASFSEALRLARESQQTDIESETWLALAKLHLGDLPEPRQEAERLTQLRQTAHRQVAELWLAIGDRELAGKHALAAYEWAWAEGEPYVYRYELERAEALLRDLRLPIPNLPPYDPAKDQKEPWELEVEQAITKLRVKKAAEEAAKAREAKKRKTAPTTPSKPPK